MKVVFLSPHNDNSGYSTAAREYILALDHIGIEVVPRSVRMTNSKAEVPERIRTLEKNDVKNVDAVIQFNLPQEFAYKGGIQNVGIFAYETSGFPNTNWGHNLELMDKVIVCCNYQLEGIKNTCPNILNRSYVLPYAIDTDKFDKDYEKMDFDAPKTTLKFYTISENNRRKNLATVIASYYSAFSACDDVLLAIKTNQGKESIQGLAENLKKSMGRFFKSSDYPKIALIEDNLSNKLINCLHKGCDVFVTASHGESFCLPYLDALGFGNPCIIPKHTSFLDYNFNLDKSLMVESNESIVLGVDGSVKGLYTADEIWSNPSLIDLKNKMLMLYKNRAKYIDSTAASLRHQWVCRNFSRKVIGNRFKELLHAE